MEVFIDADACPVKDEVYEVAARHGLYVVLVANSRMGTPPGGAVEMVVVGKDADAADDWIVENIREGDIAITADIPLAARCLEAGAQVLGPNGHPFDEDMIGSALAMRDLKSELRDSGAVSGGAPPMSTRDRSRFTHQLQRMVQRGNR